MKLAILLSNAIWVLLMVGELVLSDDGCPKLRFPNGAVKYAGRRNKKVARFVCQKGFELIGGKYAMCDRGVWDKKETFCIKSGCKRFPLLNNGMIFYLRNDAQAMFFCNPGYKLNGSPTALCDGVNWNTTMPVCKTTVEELQLSCDFEMNILCGWKNDPEHDFDWTRKYLRTPSGFLGTGPSYDHTYGKGKLGYYMYIESSSRLENDMARLISPLFPANYTENGCFQFYYHMYGSTTGTLRIYVHPENVEFGKIINNTTLNRKYTKFEKRGNQGNSWYKGFFVLEKLDTNFQIVIEGVRGSGYASDIAIDDLAILQNDNCTELKAEHFTSTIPPFTVKDSCLNRCDAIVNKTFDGENVICQCHKLCDDDKNCCVDYTDFCVFDILYGRKSNLTTDFPISTEDSTDSQSSTDAPMLPIPQKNIATKIPQDTTIDDQYKTVEYQNTTVTTTTTPQPNTTTSVAVTKATPSTTQTIVKIFTKISTTTSTAPKINTTSAGKKEVKINFDNSSVYEVMKPNATENKPVKTENDTQTTQLPIQSVSKHYGHYGRDENGKNKATNLTYRGDVEVIQPKHSLSDEEKSEKIIAVPQDPVLDKVEDKQIKKSNSPLITVFILLGVTIVAVSLVVVKFSTVSNYCGNASNSIANMNRIWTRTRSFSSSHTDMRFLVQDEELENYVD